MSDARRQQTLVARMALYLAVAYITLTTSDIDIGRVPLKLFVVAFALLGWLAVVRPWRRPRPTYRFAAPVVIGGIVVPLAWFVIALVLHHRHDPSQDTTGSTNYAIQQASRFVYLLLYFPILDEIQRCSAIAVAGADRPLRAHRVWLWPTLILCAITVLFLLGHVLLGLQYQGNLGPFQGTIAVESTGTFRAYLIDDVMLIPAMALVMGTARGGRLGNLGIGVAIAVLSAAYVSHTRGIWLGAMVAAVVMLMLSSARLPLSNLAKAVAVLLVGVFLVAFVVNADPSTSRHIVSLVTAPNELSTSDRLEQAPQLLRGFRRHVALGSGLGATLPSGFKRNHAEPWSFELSYLQLLFQLGVVGIVLLMTAPVLALYRGMRSLAHADPARRLSLATAIGGIVGFLFTSGGNPYLMTSVGMLALAVLLAMAEQAMASDQPSERATAMTPFVFRAPAFLRRLSGLRPAPPSAAFWIVMVVAILGVAEFGRSRRAVSPEPGPASPAKPVPIDALKRLALRLPAGFLADGSATLAANSEQVDDFNLWSLASSNGVLHASHWVLRSGRIFANPARPVGPAVNGKNSVFTVVEFGSTQPDALGIVTTHKSRIRVELRDMAHAGRLLLSGTTPVVPLAAKDHRDIGLANYNGTSADLIVVDRSLTAPTIRVQVFSSVSHFHQEILNVIVPRGPFPPGDYSLLIGPVGSAGADVTIVSRGATSTLHTEAHVLLGPLAFQGYGEQSPLNLPEEEPLTTTFLLGREKGVAVLYAVDRTAGVLYVVQLA